VAQQTYGEDHLKLALSIGDARADNKIAERMTNP
jgi:hypothetical protein